MTGVQTCALPILSDASGSSSNILAQETGGIAGVSISCGNPTTMNRMIPASIVKINAIHRPNMSSTLINSKKLFIFKNEMNSRRVTVKDDYTDYIIYYPYPCYQLPLIGHDIPDEGCQTVSIDIGIANFAIRIETRYRTGYIKPIYFIKINFTQYGDTSERRDRKSTRLNSSHIPLSRMPSSA